MKWNINLDFLCKILVGNSDLSHEEAIIKAGQLQSLYSESIGKNSLFFGEDLLYKFPDAVVNIVDGLAQAVICAMIVPPLSPCGDIWLATGTEDLSIKHAEIVFGRNVWLWPAPDYYWRWHDFANEYAMQYDRVLFLYRDLWDEIDGQTDIARVCDLPDNKKLKLFNHFIKDRRNAHF